MDWIAGLKERIWPMLGDVAVVLLILIVANGVAKAAQSGLLKLFKKREFEPTLSRFFAAMANYAIMTGAIIGCLGVFGVDTTSFAAVIAAMGFAVGLAFQGTLSNFSAGVMLLVFRPFKVGQVVKVNGEIGTVEAIDLFTTDLKTPDARRIIMPNSAIFGNTIENISHYPERRVTVAVGCDYTADLDQTRAVLERVTKSVDGVLAEPAPQVFLESLGASSVDWQVRVWCKAGDFWAVHEATTRAVKVALDQAKIGIPFPQMDVHLDHRPAN